MTGYTDGGLTKGDAADVDPGWEEVPTGPQQDVQADQLTSATAHGVASHYQHKHSYPELRPYSNRQVAKSKNTTENKYSILSSHYRYTKFCFGTICNLRIWFRILSGTPCSPDIFVESLWLFNLFLRRSCNI